MDRWDFNKQKKMHHQSQVLSRRDSPHDQSEEFNKLIGIKILSQLAVQLISTSGIPEERMYIIITQGRKGLNLIFNYLPPPPLPTNIMDSRLFSRV